MIIKLRRVIHLLRLKQWIKNLLVFLPLFFSGDLSVESIRNTCLGFSAYCLLASSIYIVNDIRDRESDAQHPRKMNRPIASGLISIKAAILIASGLVVCSIIISLFLPLSASGVLASYYLLNILYSFYLKRLPIVDVSVIAAGFVMRAIYGSLVSSTNLSVFFLVTILAVSLFMAFGKRRNEIDSIAENLNTRSVLQSYTRSFLDKNMYVMAALSLVFYTMWATSYQDNNPFLLASIPVVYVMLIRYSFVIEKESTEGDPSELILSDKPLLALCFVCILCLVGGIYA
jgi:4-hydroxybenzoate polyprenyltransferase